MGTPDAPHDDDVDALVRSLDASAWQRCGVLVLPGLELRRPGRAHLTSEDRDFPTNNVLTIQDYESGEV